MGDPRSAIIQEQQCFDSFKAIASQRRWLCRFYPFINQSSGSASVRQL